MRDRHNLEALLIRRFPEANREQVAAAANAIMALIDQWEADDRLNQPRRRGRIMSGSSATEALRNRFDAIREAELQRLSRKLRQLGPDERRDVESIAAEIISALALIPARAIVEQASQEDIDALSRLFALEPAE
jgi:glutamyl-tRNA reductase